MKHYASITALLAGLASAAPVRAEVLEFNLTGSKQASFQINTDTTPDIVDSSFLGDQIQYLSVSGTYGGVAETATIGFGAGPILAQLNIGADGLGFTQFGGPDLFGGDHPPNLQSRDFFVNEHCIRSQLNQDFGSG
jgi:hypothetical protein